MSDNKPNRETPQDILRKLQEESSQQKKQAAIRILQGQNRPRVDYSWWNIFRNNLSNNIQARKKEFIKQIRLNENKHLFIITFFFMGAVWISWKIEEKYDKIRSRARNTKSQKQRMVEQQNEYINKMLAKNPFEPVPIQQEQKQEQNYIFQKTQFQFDTKADLLQMMQKQKTLFQQEQLD